MSINYGQLRDTSNIGNKTQNDVIQNKRHKEN